MAEDETKDESGGKLESDDKKDEQQGKGGGDDAAGLKSALDAERKARREADAARKTADAELEALRKEKKDREEADLSEKERAEKRAAEAEARATALEARTKEQAGRYAVAIEGGKLNIVDPEDAYVLLRSRGAAITYDADGNPTNVAELLKGLVKDKPYLVKSEGGNGGNGGRPGIPETPGGDRKGLTADQIAEARRSHTAVMRSTF